jgi:predicted PurR-regulated permease PerM
MNEAPVLTAREAPGKAAVFLLSILTLVAVGIVLKQAQVVILPLIIAWLLSYILGPVVTTLTRFKLPTSVAVTLVLILLVGAAYLGATFVNARVSAFVAVYPKYQQQLNDLFEAWSGRMNLGYNPFAGVDWSDQFGRYLLRISGSLFSFVSKLLMVVFFLVFLLLGKPFFKYKLRKAFPEKSEQFSEILTTISRQIGRYLSVQFLVSFITGVLVWLALRLLKVDFAVTWGAMAFVLNFIPTVGSIVASIPPVLLALVQFYPRVWPAVGVLATLVSIQVLLGNVITPKIMGDKLNLSPVVVLLSLVFWGWLWGITGAVLAVPIASTIKIVCENIDPLQPISIMMGGGKAYRREFSG